MSKKFQVLLRSFFSFAFIVFVLGSTVIVAQTTALTGEWKADAKSEKRPEKIHLNFSRRSERGGVNQHGSSFEYSDLQGLSREQALGAGAVRFSLVREAGTIECEGRFDGTGKGSGTFRFTGNQQFVTAMKSRGFDFEAADASGKKHGELEDRLFAATTINVTTAFADDLLSANFGKLTVDDLFKAAIFKITPQFMSEMKASGFPNLGMEELVKARIFKIDANFVREVAQMGFDKEPFESLVKMRIFKVTPEFITEVKNEGLTNLDIEDLVKMRIFKIDGAFIRQAKADGVPLEVEKLVQKRIGVWGR
ncbi:MAG TPA: hypothetical protein VK400_04980 [Pyrinomonadaceae bacterium]|nr:hypothetical protein [Pyrinomonadaceae bacterium]